jgi:four helix bundle protein
MQRFTDLRVWQKSHDLVLAIYQHSKGFPPEERFGLVSQLRRAAMSIPTNIAEGSKRKTKTEYARFLNIAEGSVAETQYLLVLSRDLKYLTLSNFELLSAASDEVARMLNGLRISVESSRGNPKRGMPSTV